MMLMMVVAMVMAMAKIFAFRFYISKLPINRLRGRYVTLILLYPNTLRPLHSYTLTPLDPQTASENITPRKFVNVEI